jgi:copper chaperone
MEEITFHVSGMTCGHCKSSVERGLQELNGVNDVKVNLESKTVTVNYDQSRISKEAFVSKIDDLGYEVKV